MLSHAPIKLWCISLLMLAQLSVYAQQPGSRRKELEQQRKQLQLEIQKNKAELSKAKTQENSSLKQLQTLGRQIATREEMIDHVAQESFEISIEIANQQKVIEKLRTDLEQLRKNYGELIAAAYRKRGSQETFYYLFDAKSVNQAFRRLRYLGAYGDYRQHQAQLILNTQREMIAALTSLMESRHEKQSLIRIKEEEKKELVQDKLEESRLLGKVQQRVKELAQKIAEQEKSARKLNKAIDNLIAAEIDAARKAEERKRAALSKKSNKPAAPVTSNSYLSDADLKLSGDFAALKGRLPWPVNNGRITQTFGEHPHPTLPGVTTSNNGIDVTCLPGSGVRPVHKGTVKGTFFIPGLNNAVLVNHGEYFTVYARLEHVNVKMGQEVDPSVILGELNVNPETGTSMLHFEIWKQRVFQNPAPWLKPR